MAVRIPSWGQILGGAYVAGYWIYLVTVAVVLWPTLSFFEWLSTCAVHVAVATVWPLGAILWYVGYFS